MPTSTGVNTAGYQIGTLVKISLTITFESGSLGDPGALFFYSLSPKTATLTTLSGPAYATSQSTTQIVRVATGTFAAYINVNESGRWYYRWNATGGGQGAEDGYFDVNPSKFVSG